VEPAVSARPSGVVTFLFTDIESSTRAWGEEPAAMAEALARHDALLRGVVGEYGGALFGASGDGIVACFARATDAALAALAAQRLLTDESWPRGVQLRVRMGLHTGEAQERDGNYFGPAVNLAARIMGAAAGGQVLSSATTASLIGRHHGVELVRLGRYALKGIEGAVEIWGLHGVGVVWLERSLSAQEWEHIAGLPGRRTALVGREELINDVVGRVSGERLVTLAGPGGVGKTSLAVEVAHQCARGFGRVAFVDLATIDSDGELLAAFASALGTSSSLMSAVEVSARSDRLLLIVDNCEHVIDAAAGVVDHLLDSAPELHVIATSRESLEVPGESVVVVPTLTNDDDLWELFVRRSTAVGVSAPLTEDRGIVVELCRRLDGLPLAIELAASRSTAMSPRELLTRLDDRLVLLSTGRQRGRDRHRTLRETIDWSFGLLEPAHQDLYARLSVFVDWFDMADAAAVSGVGELVTLDGVQALVAKSVLVPAERRGRTSYRYLESIRDHAWRTLVGSGRSDDVMAAMVDRVAEKLTRLVHDLWHREGSPPIAAISDTFPAHRHAAQWCLDHGDIGRAADLFAPFEDAFPAMFPLALPGAAELADLPGADAHPRWTELAAIALWGRLLHGHFDEYRSRLARLLEVAGSYETLSRSTLCLTSCCFMAGDLDSAQRVADAQLDSVDPGRRRPAIIHSLNVKAHTRHGTPADIDRLMSLLATATNEFERGAILNAALMAAEHLDPGRVAEIAALANGVATDVTSFVMSRWQCLAGWHLGRGELSEALTAANEVLLVARRLGEVSAMIPPLVLHMLVIWKLDRPEEVARLRGAVPRRWSVYYARFREPLDAWLAERLDSDTRSRLAIEGRALSPEARYEIAPQLLDAASR
jgi:predicted ATPase/class 3 adenylate cyclase